MIQKGTVRVGTLLPGPEAGMGAGGLPTDPGSVRVLFGYWNPAIALQFKLPFTLILAVV